MNTKKKKFTADVLNDNLFSNTGLRTVTGVTSTELGTCKGNLEMLTRHWVIYALLVKVS